MTKLFRDNLEVMGKLICIALFVLLAEACQAYIYAFIAARDLATIGLLGPLAGALVGVGFATFLELFWPRLHPCARSVIYVSVVAFFISGGTTYYQCYAEQITYDGRILHPQLQYTHGDWGNDPWTMYPELGNAGFGTGCQNLPADLAESFTGTCESSFIWFPVVILISWITTRKPSPPRQPDLRDAVPA